VEKSFFLEYKRHFRQGAHRVKVKLSSKDATDSRVECEILAESSRDLQLLDQAQRTGQRRMRATVKAGRRLMSHPGHQLTSGH